MDYTLFIILECCIYVVWVQWGGVVWVQWGGVCVGSVGEELGKV